MRVLNTHSHTSERLGYEARKNAMQTRERRLRTFLALGVFFIFFAIRRCRQFCFLSPRHPKASWLKLDIFSKTSQCVLISVGYRIDSFDVIVRKRYDNIPSNSFDNSINDNDAIKRWKTERLPRGEGIQQTAVYQFVYTLQRTRATPQPLGASSRQAKYSFFVWQGRLGTC